MSFHSSRQFVLSALALALLSGLAMADEKKPAEKVTYADHVQPIFRSKCFACHNPDKKSGGLDLTNFTAMMQGGSSGAAIEPGDIESSYLWNLVNHDAEPYMPPKSDKLPAAQLLTIKSWINGGALDTKSSKSLTKKKAKMEFALSFAPTERPPGPPAMPARLSLEPVVHTEKTTAVTAIATSPWAPLAAVAGQKQVLLYNTKSLELVGVLPFPEGIAHVLKFSRSGQLLLAGGGTGASSGRCVVWNVKSGERLVEVGDEFDTVLGADISGDQTMIALGGPAKMVRVYSTQTGEKLYEVKKHTDWITSMSFSPDGVLLASGDRNGGVFVWEADTGREYLGLRGHSKRIRGFSWRIDSNVLASASEDSTVRLWEMENGRQLRSIGAHGGGAMGVWFNRDGNIATVGRDRTAKLWNQSGGAIRTFEAFPDLGLQVAYCDETKRMIAGDFSGLVRVWNAADGKRLGELSTNPEPLSVLLSQATAALSAAQAEQKKQADAYNAIQVTYNKTVADLAAKTKLVATYAAQEKANLAKTAEVQKTIADSTTKSAAAAKLATELGKLVPTLTEAAAKADAAGAIAKTDQALVAAVAALKKVAGERSASLATAKKTQTDETNRLNAAKQLLATTQKALVALRATAVANQNSINALKTAQTNQQKQVAAAKAALASVTAKVDSAKSAVQKWEKEIAFSEKLAEFKNLESQLDELLAAHEEASVELQAAQGVIATAESKLASAQATMKTAAVAVTVSQAKVAKLTADQMAKAKDISVREAAVPTLKDAADKGAAAAAALASDKELATAAAQLKAAFDRNNKAIADGKQALADATKTVVASQAELKQMQANASAASAAVAEAAKQLQAVQAAMKPVADKASKAKELADKARANIDRVGQQLDSIRQPPATTAQAG